MTLCAEHLIPCFAKKKGHLQMQTASCVFHLYFLLFYFINDCFKGSRLIQS
jgi:hypothetical protein